MSGFGHDSDDKSLSETFAEHVGEQYQDEVSLDGNLNATAKALMAHEKERVARETEQKQKQKDIRDGLAAGDVPVPTNEMGGNAGRDLEQEYNNRMGDWHRETEAIEAHMETTRIEIRDEGDTLVDHWENTAYYEVTSPEVQHEMPWDMRAAFDEAADKTFLLDEDYADGLNFEVPQKEHDNGHDKDGGRSR